MQNYDAKIFALRVTDAKNFLIENWWCEADAKFFALRIGGAKLMRNFSH